MCLPISFNVCFGCSKEPPFEYPQHMFWLACQVIFHDFFVICWFFSKLIFTKNYFRNTQCQMVWIQTWVQTIGKGYQQTTNIHISSCKKVRWNKESHPEINGPAYKISKLIASTSSHHSDKPSHMVSLTRSFTSHIHKYGGRERPKPKIILLAWLV